MSAKQKEKTAQIRIRLSSYNRMIKSAGRIPYVDFVSDIIDEKCKKQRKAK